MTDAVAVAPELPHRFGLQPVGVSLLYAQPPLAPVHLPLHQGLHVLYGLNGAGKSQVLRLIEHALDGRSSPYRPTLHLQLTRERSVGHLVARELAQDLLDVLTSRGGIDIEPADDEPANYVHTLYSLLRALDMPADVAAEIADQGALTLTRQGGQTVVSVGVRFGSASPALTAVLQRWATPWRWQDADLFAPSDVEAPFADRLERPVRLPIRADEIPDLSDDIGRLVSTALGDDGAEDLPVPAWLVDIMREVLEPGDSAVDLTRKLLGHDAVEAHPELSRDAYQGFPFDPWLSLRVRAAFEQHRRQQAPGWVSWPILELGVLDANRWVWPGALVPWAGDETSVDELLSGAMDRLGLAALFVPEGDRVLPDRRLRELLDRVGARATDIAQRCVPGSPSVIAEVIVPARADVSPLKVRAVSGNGTLLPFSALSEAQRRWCETGLRLALMEALEGGNHPGDSVGAAVLLLDEPDASLHASARRTLPQALGRLADTGSMALIVATHGTEFIAARDAALLHVLTTQRYGSPLTEVRPIVIGDLLSGDLQAVGLTPASVTQLTRLYLIVEGDHDAAILDTWIGSELRDLGVEVLRMRGDHNLLSVLESQLLWDASDASVLVWLDHSQHMSRLTATWERVRSVRNPARVRAELEALGKGLPRARRGEQVPSAAVLLQFMRAAVERGVQHRLAVSNHREHDVMHLLPVTAFPGAGSSWKQFEAARPAGVDCKTHLQSLTQQYPSTRVVAERAASTPVHEDVSALLLLARELCRSSQSSRATLRC